MSSAVNRLPAQYGLLLDRNRKMTFRFEGERVQGCFGDCIASALAANDRWLLSRSFKYHRPRGILTMAGQDANSLVQLPGDPNVPADRHPISPELEVTGQNYTGSLKRDRAAWVERFSRFMPVGFYYKSFFRPKGAWEKWAPIIRGKAGLGVLDEERNPDYYDKQHRFYDVAVIGGGPAGMEAALQAANSGAEVLLVEENPILGGSLNYSRLDPEGRRAGALRTKMVAGIEANEKIDVMVDAVCNGWYADNWLPVIRDRRLHKVRAGATIMCTGALEQHAVFRNNDLPGIMMSSAAQRLIHLYGVRPGRTAVILAGNNDAYGVALDLLDAGVDVKQVVELRKNPQYDDLARSAMARNIAVKTGHAVYEALSESGDDHLSGVDVREVLSDGVCARHGKFIECDLLCTAVGYMPAYQLICQAGGRLDYDDETAGFRLTHLPDSCQLAGSVSGKWDMDCVIADARRAGVIAGNAFRSNAVPAPDPIHGHDADSPNFEWPIFPHPDGKEFVDFDEDLTIADIINSVRDGYEHVQLVKRYSTCGMGPSQGRHSAFPTARLVAQATGKSVAQTGVTTARPPFAAERLAHCAGRGFHPSRRSNIHYRHLEAGAQMLQVGDWFRPAYYGPKGARAEAIRKEVQNVRNNVGLVDVSTLGGIELRGADAGEFLNRIYTSDFANQSIGRARYALLTNESGVIVDDGIVCRLHEHHYYATTTTGGATRVYQDMVKWNSQWRLDVDIDNVSSAWCGINIAGPEARSVLETLCHDVDLSAASFPYMGVRAGTVAGIPARLIRVGFVGELGYEIHVPHHFGEALWDALMAAGMQQKIMPFGIEAQRVLRLEKKHIIVGQDTDAVSNPLEVQMGWAVSRKKPFFVGKRTIDELRQSPLKRKLVGFVVDDRQAPVPPEGHLVLDGEQIAGRVTSCEHSPTLDKPVGLAYVPVEKAVTDSQIIIKSTAGARVTADVVDLPFYDPENRRQDI
ncbi:MAG: glycine cleavage T C-terminal barrel domain-containing protein [Gammaproteobacteria bacterium]